MANMMLDSPQVVVGVSTLAIYLWNLVNDRPSYGPSKSAGTLILQQFARAFKPEELQVSVVHPGAVWTEGMKEAGGTEGMYKFDDGESRHQSTIDFCMLTSH